MVSLSDSLWHRNRVLAEAALEHTFVQGIASGVLARATFAYYVGQDAAFLDAFCLLTGTQDEHDGGIHGGHVLP